MVKDSKANTNKWQAPQARAHRKTLVFSMMTIKAKVQTNNELEESNIETQNIQRPIPCCSDNAETLRRQTEPGIDGL
jgi:hypothetical protein